jgi:hypothetical protein
MPERLRYFTLDEANDLLPSLASRMAVIHDKLLVVREILRREAAGTEVAHDDDAARLDALKSEIEVLIDDILSQGVEVKGLAPGLLDFPALRHGAEVLLCWAEGEPEITHWHPTTTGFAGRQRLDPRDVWEYDN